MKLVGIAIAAIISQTAAGKCSYDCSEKSDKCCKKTMKGKDKGRKPEEKCYLDSTKTSKDNRCVDLTACEQVTKKGWCNKFFNDAPLSCSWNKKEKICQSPKPEEICATLVSPDAPYDYSVTALRQIADMGIVMDVSGSMATEIKSVKKGIIAAINMSAKAVMAGHPPPYHRGAVMEFSDPSIRFLGLADGAGTRINIAKMQLGMGKGEAGGDCPEVIFKAINATMDIINDWSTIYAITDAGPKDSSMVGGVISKAKERHIRINFILTGTCKPSDVPPFLGIHGAYKMTAAGTGGQIYQINKDASTLGPAVTAVFTAAANDALATSDVAEFELKAGTNDISLDGYNHQTNFHISVVGLAAGLDCRNQNTGAPVEGHTVLISAQNVKTWSIPRVNDAGVHLWHNNLVCQTSASRTYKVTVRSGYSQCKMNWCKNGGECTDVKMCKLFTCKCNGDWEGTYCHVAKPTVASVVPLS